MKGNYILVISVNNNINVQIGKLGNLFFKKGFYTYIGSAMGKSGSSTLENRVKRHLSSDDRKKTHWHIDFLLKNKEAKIIKLELIPIRKKIECTIAQELLDLSDGFIENFGCSDCNCRSHLIYFKNNKQNFLKNF
ncbi:MAG: DUF123 domain-containing protein [Promethearchaeota archaeon]